MAGSSRGAGRGIALALGDAGATVYVAARTSRHGPKPADGAPGTVEDTAEEVCARGGQGIPVRADLGNEEEAATLFRRVEEEHGRLDLMVDSAWGATIAEWSKPFWELSAGIWRDTAATIDAAWLTSVHAARIMVKQRRGLLIHVTDNIHSDVSAYRGQILWDLGHEFLNRLIADMSRELQKSKVAMVGLNPGFMRTERVLRHMTTGGAQEAVPLRSERIGGIHRARRGGAGSRSQGVAQDRTVVVGRGTGERVRLHRCRRSRNSAVRS